MGRGGAREGSGPKPKWRHPETGVPLETYSIRIPTLITKQDIQDLLVQKVKEGKDK